MSINNDVFDGMIVFREVVEADGFTAAARNLGHSPSHVSKAIARLEDRLGARLLNRTTRTISLTEIGQVYYEQARQIIDDAREAQHRISSAGERAFGLLRVSIPVSFGLTYLNGWLPEFLDMYPDIKLKIEASDRIIDIVAEGYDVVVRAGQLDDAEFIAKRLMTSRRMTVAAPDYLERQGLPKNPAELSEHVLIDFSYRHLSGFWDYAGEGGNAIRVPVSPRIVCNSAETELALAVAGVGITRLPGMACRAALAGGDLVAILETFEEPPIGIFAVYPSRSHLAAKVRVFVDFLDDKLNG